MTGGRRSGPWLGAVRQLTNASAKLGNVRIHNAVELVEVGNLRRSRLRHIAKLPTPAIHVAIFQAQQLFQIRLPTRQFRCGLTAYGTALQPCMVLVMHQVNHDQIIRCANARQGLSLPDRRRTRWSGC